MHWARTSSACAIVVPDFSSLKVAICEIFKSYPPDGREQVFTVEGPGSSVAELPVFYGGTYPASTVATDKARVHFISKQDFHSLCLVHPKVAIRLGNEESIGLAPIDLGGSSDHPYPGSTGQWVELGLSDIAQQRTT